jgi:hypothetical protein
MRQIAMATVLSLAAAFGITAQTPTPRQKSAETAKPEAVQAAPVIKCKGPDGKPCTAKQVETLSDGCYSGKRQHEALALVKSVTLASSDGTLKCEQNDGKPCTTEQLDAVKQVGASQQTYINYNSSKSNTAK